MPFQDQEGSREELCRLALAEGTNRRQLCRRFNVRPRILYKWLERYRSCGRAGLADHSRRPHRSPSRTEAEMESAVLAVRRENPVWGGRKIAASLRRQGLSPPSPSTITGILRRNGQPMVAPGQKAWKRFEHAEPNALWQMDFKGDVALGHGRLHPLTVVDDHSRYAVVLQAADNERHQTVQNAVQAAFERYGLPEVILTDNGSPWGDTGERSLTKLGVWLIEHGVAPWHSAPFHPQSHGKNERFNRTLKAELLEGRTFGDLQQAQQAFDGWRQRYNHHRPHDALGLAVPAERYRPSPRSFNPIVEPFDYGPDDFVRSVDVAANISFRGRRLKASKALVAKHVAIRPTERDGVFDIIFRHVTVKSIDFHNLA
ncbi:MAG TPA: IS481 family transposase [Reyranella sp.]|jgi:transposase InsO family protein|nr:IS481 family transposase [Reyranella sp.]